MALSNTLRGSVQTELKNLANDQVRNKINDFKQKIIDQQSSVGTLKGKLPTLPDGIPLVPKVKSKLKDIRNLTNLPTQKYNEYKSKLEGEIGKVTNINIPGKLDINIKPPTLPGLPPGVAEMQSKIDNALNQIDPSNLPDLPSLPDIPDIPDIPNLGDLPQLPNGIDINKTIQNLKHQMITKLNNKMKAQKTALEGATAGTALAGKEFLI